MDADREACAAAGMSDFLAKPIRPQELADVLERSPIRDDPAVDWGTLRTHVRGMAGMDDHELERDLAEDFVTGAPVLLAAIDSGLEVGDPTEVRRAAHTLKSHAALFGASQLETLSRRLEELAAAAEPGDEMAAVAQALRAGPTGCAISWRRPGRRRPEAWSAASPSAARHRHVGPPGGCRVAGPLRGASLDAVAVPQSRCVGAVSAHARSGRVAEAASSG